ncbi:MAG: MFS transporter [Chthoniobacterales bacterium]|nr:MFS transporter [Chthoniobacterales bacterium]MBA3608278.1 MFS transporter [Chthoniobacterales bacterium]
MAASSEPTGEISQAHDRERVKLRGVSHIIGYEAAERFAFYGMLTVLGILLTSMAPSAGEAETRSFITWLGVAVACLAFIGAIVAEAFLGKFKTVLVGSVMACAGYAALVLSAPGMMAAGRWPILALGLGLVALGTGAVKPCIAAHLGDQFHEANRHLLAKMFGWFYFVIHAAPLLAGVGFPHFVADHQNGLRWALALPLLALAAGTLLLWSGRSRFVQIPPFGRSFRTELFSREAGKAVGALLGLYIFVALFWIAWQQGAESWARQASRMDLRLFPLQLLPEQVSTANVIFILLFVPLLNYAVYPMADRFVAVTPLRKIGTGLSLTGLSFGIAALLQYAIDGGARPAVGWQLVAWAFLTMGEVMVIVTALELSYTWAPRRIKSVVMSVWLLTFGVRGFSSQAGSVVGGGEGVSRMSDFTYYLFFAGLMLAATVLFAFVAKFYRYKTYLQSQDQPVDEDIVPPVLGGGAPT